MIGFRRKGESVAWPLTLAGVTPFGEQFQLRPLRWRDQREFRQVRLGSRDWLEPWDATTPVGSGSGVGFSEYVRVINRSARQGCSVPLVIESSGRIVGQVNASGIIDGSFRSCTIGYWIAAPAAGRWMAPSAVATLGDYLLAPEPGGRGLHRIEINVRPENAASLAVVRKLGLRDEGVRERLLHIDGGWRDHRSFAATVEDLAGASLMSRVTRAYQQSHARHTD